MQRAGVLSADPPLALGPRGRTSTSPLPPEPGGGLPVGKNWLRQRNDVAFLCSFPPSISHDERAVPRTLLLRSPGKIVHLGLGAPWPWRSRGIRNKPSGPLGGLRELRKPTRVTAPGPRSWAARRDLRRTVGHPVQTVNTSGYHVFWPWGRTLFPSIQGSATLHLKASPSSPPFPSHPQDSPVL